MIDQLTHPEIQLFIEKHKNEDPFKLGLKYKEVEGVPFALIATQIKSRQKAKTKLPEWYNTSGVIYPPTISMEQCSSEIAAKHKSKLIDGHSLIDLTGGTGIDTFYLSKVFKKVIYVDTNANLCEIAKYNFKVLGAKNIQVIHSDSVKFINTYDESVSAIFIDPARRDEHNQKVFMWQDCEPNLIEIQDRLLSLSKQVLVKSSPMLDITGSLNSLKNVTQVEVLAIKNECKEVLYLMESKNHNELVEMNTINILNKDKTQQFKFKYQQEANATVEYSKVLNYLYEPNVAIMKAGGFKSIGAFDGLFKLHQHSHLYTSDQLIENFTGRVFKIKKVCSFNKKEIHKHLKDKKTNITVRNFPMSVENIRKKIQVKSGGTQYLFATTDINEERIILICEKG